MQQCNRQTARANRGHAGCPGGSKQCKPGRNYRTTMKSNEISYLHEGYTYGHRDLWVASLAMGLLPGGCSPVSSNKKPIVVSNESDVTGMWPAIVEMNRLCIIGHSLIAEKAWRQGHTLAIA
eukprot:scaffold9070_cov38-Prasinocladus_malaysianus.AAC.2